jgi:hypothetical protein
MVNRRPTKKKLIRILLPDDGQAVRSSQKNPSPYLFPSHKNFDSLRPFLEGYSVVCACLSLTIGQTIKRVIERREQCEEEKKNNQLTTFFVGRFLWPVESYLHHMYIH